MKHLKYIRESKVQKFFEYSSSVAYADEKGSERRKKLGGRSEVIDMENVEEVLEKYAYWYDVYCETLLFRGLKMNDVKRRDKFLLIDPSKHKRISVDTDNYYNLIIDNDKKWKDYPKRSESIIATTDFVSAADYGTVYQVIPLFENSKIAVTPKQDIWFSFSKYFKSENPMYTKCKECDGEGEIEVNKGSFVDCAYCDASGEQRVLNLETFNRKLREDFRLNKNNYTWSEFKKKLGKLLPYVTKIFDPKYNGFELKEYNNNTDIGNAREVWTDAKCLLIRTDLLP